MEGIGNEFEKYPIHMFNGRINNQGKKVGFIWRTNEPPSFLPPTATVHDKFLLVFFEAVSAFAKGADSFAMFRGKRRLSQI